MTDARFPFTKRAIEALPRPEARRRYHDTAVRGLTLMVWPTGGRDFYYYRKVAGRPIELKLGPYPDITIEQARAAAEGHNATVAHGLDPRQDSGRERGKDEWTFAQLGDWWITYARDIKKKKSWEFDAWLLKMYFSPLSHRQLSKINKSDMRQLHIDITTRHGPDAANRAMEVARAMFNRAIRHEKIPGPNPVDAVEWNKRTKRDRRLQPGEIKAFFDALDAEPAADIRVAG